MPAVIVAAVLAIGSSSSLAVVLLAVLLAAGGMIGPGLGIALALGANLGRAVAPMIATFGHGAVARRTTVGNLLLGLVGSCVALPLAEQAASALLTISNHPTSAWLLRQQWQEQLRFGADALMIRSNF
ncbi:MULTISPECIES: hypothetical protein [unclassified Mesorhizobium]|uniref:hypothetical protein n=1 Tax=unclassified Mesorhizobium TaxID=325217 RepID=UPI000FD80AEE|nr:MULTISPECIES: hypothetical protein [unclassified Mesorhizobium]TGQ35804.1 hypothetical protein EN859_022610 [Mesorhizobium sp. M00.F.Ca.ET.216.01.1.1]TGQ35811.1 hypothetical protein EN859_022655 [Mesorhizobium sp. M00.F.Ca.ET.216.01.1.1]TIS52826.1 MAG: hypothetical protein E5W91_33155 [Mesorhizobium sp.]TIS85228.1 MAG: hypothetical protein E5W89_33520 [Mesorhizobium sp.]